MLNLPSGQPGNVLMLAVAIRKLLLSIRPTQDGLHTRAEDIHTSSPFRYTHTHPPNHPPYHPSICQGGASGNEIRATKISKILLEINFRHVGYFLWGNQNLDGYWRKFLGPAFCQAKTKPTRKYFWRLLQLATSSLAQNGGANFSAVFGPKWNLISVPES